MKIIKTTIKPKINPNLKIRKATDPEIAIQEGMERYRDKYGKTTFKKTAKLLKDMGAKALKRIVGIDAYKKGGKVKKTVLALVHKGEKVLTKKQQKKTKVGNREMHKMPNGTMMSNKKMASMMNKAKYK